MIATLIISINTILYRLSTNQQIRYFMTNYGLVSIITPSWNCAKFIAETINSIQKQTYQNWELLITDDCSDDKSIEIIEQYSQNDSRIRLFKFKENRGAGIARNNSIKEAKGRFIAFCDSDDRWKPTKLERQLEFMINGNHHLTYTSYDTCNEYGEIIGTVQCLKKINYYKIIRDNGIGCLTAIYDSSKIGKQYMPSIRKRQDWCLWIEIIKKNGAAFGLQESLAIYRDRSDSISSNKIEMLKYNFNVYHDVRGYSKFFSVLILAGYFMPYYFYKKIRQKIYYKKTISIF